MDGTTPRDALADYDLGEVEFRGRDARVHRARRRADDARVYVKRHASAHPSQAEIERFRRDFELGRRVGAEGSVSYVDLLIDGPGLAVVTEDLGVRSLSESIVPGRPLGLETALRVGVGLARALEVVHAADVVHGDVKPANVVVDLTNGRARFIDFGSAAPLSRQNERVAAANAFMGTLAYNAPEQTGRTNRKVDTRADLYALGVTLFEIFAAALPFQEADPLALVHAHLARVAPRLDATNEAVPSAIADVVVRLLAKDPDDRYQTAQGLANDLEHCLREWLARGTVERFTLGRRDSDARLVIAQRLYGRDAAFARLRERLDTTCGGGSDLVLVAGYPGIGKSALLDELEHPTLLRSGLFAHGRFEQFRRDAPYAGIASALSRLLRSLEGLQDEVRATLVGAVREELAELGRALFDVVPEVEALVPQASPLTELGVEAARERLFTAVRALLRGLGRDGRPIVLVVDDLQWADEASLHLLRALVGSVEHVLFLGALRDQEVGPSHPLALTVEAMGAARGRPIERIVLGPLERDDVKAMLVDTLRAPEADVARLADLVHARTSGNPFFLRQLLYTLRARDVLRFDPVDRRWRWDEAALERVDLEDDVVLLLRHRIAELDADARALLALAACVGAEAPIETLALVDGSTSESIATRLLPAFTEGFLRSVDAGHGYRFLHDRVQQAVLDALSPAERQAVHERVGDALLSMLPEDADDERVIEVVSHCNRAIDPAMPPSKRARLVELNARAARRALASSAFDRTETFLSVARELHGPEGHASNRALALELASMLAAALRARSDQAGLTRLLDEVEAYEKDPLALASIYEHYMYTLTSLRDPKEALALGGRVLARFGIRLPEKPNEAHLLPRIAKLRLSLAFRVPTKPSDLREQVDERAYVETRLLVALQEQGWTVSPLHGAFFLLELGVRANKLGRTAYGGVCWSLAGVAWTVLFDDAVRGAQLCELGLDLCELTGRRDLLHLCLPGYSVIIAPWLGHLEDTLEVAMRGYRYALDAGDSHHAAQFPEIAIFHKIFLGHDLPTLLRDLDRFTATSSLDEGVSVSFRYIRQYVACLLGKAADPSKLQGEHFDAWVEREKESDQLSRFGIALHDLMLAVLLGDDARVKEALATAVPDEGGARDTFMRAVWPYYAVLALARGADPPRARRRMRGFASAMTKLAKRSPENVEHRAALIRAELARLEKRPLDALEEYRASIALAKRNRWPHEEAIAHERLARFFLEGGDEHAARGHLQEATYGYLRWGAMAKVSALRAEFPLVNAGPDSVRTQGSATSTTASGGAESLDLVSVTRAAQALSRVVERDALIARLLELSAENAGARRGAIFVLRGDVPFLEAEFEVREDGHHDVRRVGGKLDDRSHRLPRSLVNAVIRAKTVVVIDDLQVPDEADPHLELAALRAAGARSVMAIPLLQKGEALGALVLENELVAGAFTPGRVTVLEVLASQAAISLDNAALYQDLQGALERQVALTDANRRFVPNEFIGSLGHESITAVELGDSVQKEMSVLFSDVRGFTSLVEGMSPEENIGFINEYLAAMEPAILAHGGFVDSYIGDAIMALFDGSSDRAVRAAITMLRALSSYNERRNARGDKSLRIGIGVNTGLLTLGTIGGPQRIKCGVIGDPVNLGARIETATKRYGVPLLVSDATIAGFGTGASFDLREIDRVRVVGRRTPTTIYEVFDADPPALRDAKRATLPAWREAIAAWRDGDTKLALARFEECRARLPDDPVTAMRLARSRAIDEERLPGTWDDVVDLRGK